MTAGHGLAHAEEASGSGSCRGPLNGIQLWIAQPEATRHGPPAFEHHAQLPMAEYRGAVATVLVGDLDGHRSPARHDTPLVGVEVDLHDTATLPLRADFVGRTRGEIDQASSSWLSDDGRFAPVASPLRRIVTGPPPWW